MTTHPRNLTSFRSATRRGTLGFTLVELLVALMLSTFLIGGVILIYSSGSAAIHDGQKMSRAQENLRFISNFLVQDIRMTGYNGQTLLTNYAAVTDNGDTLTIRYQSPRDCLGVSTLPLDEDEVVANPGITQNTYTLRDNQIICTGKRGNTQPLVDGVRSLQFELIDGASDPIGVVIRFGLEDEPFENSVYEFQIGFRNPIISEVFASAAP